MNIRVHSYESLGTFDGPGLRLVVFLQGCNFRCLYCANPDTIDARGESKETDIEDIVHMAMNEKPFFGKRGGVTFSGGEPTFQAKALVPLVKRLHEPGLHVCLDTNGRLWNSAVEELLSIVDLVMLDIKQFNPERHTVLTERQNKQTLETAKWLHEHCHEYGYILRYPDGMEGETGIYYKPWHYRYVGREAAAFLTEHNLTLEEYWRQYGNSN